MGTHVGALPSSLCPGVHAVGGQGQTDRRNSWAEGAGVGSEEHGLRSAAAGVQPQVPDPLYQSLPQQTGT